MNNQINEGQSSIRPSLDILQEITETTREMNNVVQLIRGKIEGFDPKCGSHNPEPEATGLLSGLNEECNQLKLMLSALKTIHDYI